jgi:type IX secretion system PorP/SprF family membrane protein
MKKVYTLYKMLSSAKCLLFLSQDKRQRYFTENSGKAVRVHQSDRKHALQFSFIIGVLFLLLALPGAKGAFAQGTYFSQNGLTPLWYNPAIPAIKDEASVMLNYRNQQANSQLGIHSFSLNGMLPLYNKDKSRRWGGIGLGVLSDKAEEVSSLLRQQLNASFAYTFGIAGQHRVALGSQLAYSQQRLSFGTVTTGSQWVNNQGFDPGVGTGENFTNEKRQYWSAGAGIMLYRQQADGGLVYQLGASAYHLNQPQISFLEQEHKHPINYRAHAALTVPAGRSFAVLPELQWQEQAGQQLWSLGSAIRYKFENDNPFDPIASGSLDFLARTNLNEAVVFGVQLHQPGYILGFSYDWGFGSSRYNKPGYHASEFGIAIRKSIGRKKEPKLLQGNSIGEVRQFFTEEEKQQKVAQTEPQVAGGNTTSPSGTAAAAPAAYVGNGVAMALKKDFKFGFNEAVLNEEARQYLYEMAELMHNNAHLKLQVVGHTDDIGTRKANKLVSERRAAAVQAYLLEQGIAAERISAEGRGDSEPLLANSSEENRAKNRRVEFILFTK